MIRRKRWTWLAGVAVLAAGLALLAAACGGGGNKAESSTTTTAGGGAQKTFANFRIVYDTGLDYLDPAYSYTVQGWAVMWNVYLSLLGYKHVNGPDGATIIPALAKDLPQVSADGLISGITTDDATGKITIKLLKPQGDFQNILATIFAAPVPPGTSSKDQSTTPIPSTGPYKIQSYAPNRQFVLVRNPNFQPTDNVPATNPDKMTVKIVEDDSAALQQVINGQADYDFHPIPVDRLANVQQKYGDQLKIYTPANTYYYFMNTRLPPFDKLEVRQAVNYAIDRNALVRLYGGLATPTENILPPTYPQYKKHTLYPLDLAKAKQLIQQAGVSGTTLEVWGNSRETSKKPVEYLTDVLNKIGFKATPKIIDAAVYWTTIGNQKTKAQIGFADWFQDYPHPLDWFDVLLNGTRITDTHNNNYSNFDDPTINSKIAELKQKTELNDTVNAQWAALDKQVMQKAAWVPYVNRQFTDFFSKDIDTGCYINHVLYQFDFSRICMK